MGLLPCRGADFHFFDATDDICDADLDLLFERNRLYLHKTTGRFGAVPMTLSGRCTQMMKYTLNRFIDVDDIYRTYTKVLWFCFQVCQYMLDTAPALTSPSLACAPTCYTHAGDLDLNPVTGEYRLSASVPGVEVNQLRATLGVRPTPQPVAGVIAGVLHVTGPLEKPVFSGTAMGVRPTAAQLADCERTDALAALLAEPTAVGAWDRVPLAAAGAVFELDTAQETMRLHSMHAELVDGGQVRIAACFVTCDGLSAQHVLPCCFGALDRVAEAVSCVLQPGRVLACSCAGLGACGWRPVQRWTPRP